MPRRAIIHVGAPRTGTTTLQTLLARHRAALAAAGVLYPMLTPASAAGAAHINHQHLGETLDGRRSSTERRELVDNLERQLAETACDVLVLSYERMAQAPRWRGVPKILDAVLARHGFAMELLVTVRPQAGAAQSRYTWRCQFLREARPFRDAFARDIRDPRFHPAAGLSAWLEAARGRVTAVPLRDARSPAPFAQRVAAALGLGDRFGILLSPEDLMGVENRSLGAVAAEASRRLRAAGVCLSDNAAARRVGDALVEEVRRRDLDDIRFQGLDSTMIESAERRYARANDAFARRMWGEPWSHRVAPDRMGPITDLGRRPPSPDVETALAEICSVMQARLASAHSPPTGLARCLAWLARH